MINFLKNICTSLVPMKLVTNNYNPVILYHSLGASSKFKDNIDHVDLETLHMQLKTIKNYWKFISIDEYTDIKNKKGLASLTIDDGYKNIINEALEVFEDLKIPITIFINSSTFSGKIFWRDKVRYLIENNKVSQFIKKSSLFEKKHENFFYSISKSPKYNSIQVENEIDDFLQKEKIELTDRHKFCFDDNSYFIDHPLVSYGNHTSNHYVLSSLNKSEQFDEISHCKNFLDKFKINKSKVFSIPFGGNDSFNNDTILHLNNLNYKAVLKSTNDLDNIFSSIQINRFMPKSFKIENTIKKLYLKKMIRG